MYQKKDAMSWLTYGLTNNNDLVSIRSVPRGRSELHCPYCAGLLTAKKGKKIAHHFAHSAETCSAMSREAGDLPLLPFYDRFDLDLTKSEMKELSDLWHKYGSKGRKVPKPQHWRLIDQALLQWNDFIGGGDKGGYVFTKLGKIPFGGLSMMLFERIQHDFFFKKLSTLELAAQRCLHEQSCELDIRDALADIRLYRAQLKRLLENSLYYLKIKADDSILYKIGVTNRDSAQRVKEIHSDLRPYFQSVAVEIVNCWEHRGSAEHYFKHRYRMFNYPIGSLTEYFQFPAEVAKQAQRDLRRMGTRTLDVTEEAILTGSLSGIEADLDNHRRAYAKYEREVVRARAISVGMRRSARWGGSIGRPKGQEKAEDFLKKPKSQAVIRALKEGLSLRQTSDETGTAINTVRKVKSLRNLWTDACR